MIKISIIAAVGENRELGKGGKLLWQIPEDMKRFKKLTTGHVVIMGRKTFESLPKKFRPLPNRINVVITHEQKKFALSHPELVWTSDVLSASKNRFRNKFGMTKGFICSSFKEALTLA